MRFTTKVFLELSAPIIILNSAEEYISDLLPSEEATVRKES
jgi:hypothetical protein